MSEPTTQQEPSIEEILASIRRIISEDGDAEGGDAVDEVAAADAEPDAPPAVLDDVLELTERVDDPPADVAFADTVTSNGSGESPAQEPIVTDDFAESDALVSEPTEQRTTDVLARLAPREADRTDDPLPISHRTLEEVVREMMRPMLREWLDTHLPGIVERAVERELRRMSRRAEELH